MIHSWSRGKASSWHEGSATRRVTGGDWSSVGNDEAWEGRLFAIRWNATTEAGNRIGRIQA
jgi:hypothetical protein